MKLKGFTDLKMIKRRNQTTVKTIKTIRTTKGAFVTDRHLFYRNDMRSW